VNTPAPIVTEAAGRSEHARPGSAYVARIAGQAGVPVPEGFLKIGDGQAGPAPLTRPFGPPSPARGEGNSAAALPSRLPFHPYADLFPLIEGTEFEDLVEDIRENGLQEEIELLAGAVLDGRNRYLALCAIAERGLMLGAGWKPFGGQPLRPAWLDPDPEPSPMFVVFDGQAHGEPLAYVLSKNLRRRHLNPSQRAMVAAGIANMRQGERTDLGEPSANLQKVSLEQAAEDAQVSPRSAATAREVIKTGIGDLQDAVRQGKASVSAAAEIARLSQDEQKRVLAEIAAQPETKRAFISTVKELRRERQDEKRSARETREADLGAKQAALPDRRYGVILADPEWRFEPWSRETGLDRAADNHYPTSVTEVIAARPVATIAATDSVCLLWATAPMLPHALAVLAAWGFDYRTHIIWRKAEPASPGSSRTGRPVLGTGYWFRNAHEILLVGVRGNPPCPAMGDQWPSIVDAPPLKHSQKPDWQYELLETYFPNLPKIELNARRARKGWDAWGLEAPESPALPVPPIGSGASAARSSPLPDHDPETGEIIEAQPHTPSSPLEGEVRPKGGEGGEGGAPAACPDPSPCPSPARGEGTMGLALDRDPQTEEIIEEFQAPDTRHIAGAVDSHASAVTGLPAAPSQSQAKAAPDASTPSSAARPAGDGRADRSVDDAVDLDIPPILRWVQLSQGERGALASLAAAAERLDLNQRMFVRWLADHPERATVLDRQYLAMIVAKHPGAGRFSEAAA
jgi:N6-adenosine-specific RNA methylase IME4